MGDATYMKHIVISGINLFEGGTLSIYKDCLESIIINKLYEKNKITIFVHKKELFKEYFDKLEVIELPKSRNNYFYRLWYEYIYFYFYSKDRDIDIWLSLHDITPNVKAKRRYVYCHNASPFYKMEKSEVKFEPKLRLFNLFYKYLYAINIKKNDYVIVQQNWIKEEFKRLFSINRVLVAHPNISLNLEEHEAQENISKKDSKMFFYPSIPRVFKNFEVICQATRILVEKGVTHFNVVLTMDGKENEYSRYVVNKYNYLENINFVGLIKRTEVFDYYNKADFLIFPSKLESWGLPITEFKLFNKPLILANLAYAKETLGSYDKAIFFNPINAEELAEIMETAINDTISWEQYETSVAPDSASWKELLDIIFSY